MTKGWWFDPLHLPYLVDTRPMIYAAIFYDYNVYDRIYVNAMTCEGPGAMNVADLQSKEHSYERT
jgi:hypothetical protein